MKCFNRNVLLGLAATGVAVFLFAPSVASAAIPLLVFLACPLSMVVMMRAMSGGRCAREDTETNAPQTVTVGSAEVEIARLRAEVDQLRAEQANVNREHLDRDGVALEERG